MENIRVMSGAGRSMCVCLCSMYVCATQLLPLDGGVVQFEGLRTLLGCWPVLSLGAVAPFHRFRLQKK